MNTARGVVLPLLALAGFLSITTVVVMGIVLAFTDSAAVQLVYIQSFIRNCDWGLWLKSNIGVS